MRADAILQRVNYDFPQDGKIVVGFSGGADSTLLTYLLLRHFGPERLLCIHVNHCIRGAEADRDENFVREFCTFHRLKLEVLKKDIPAMAKESGEGLEECARRVRYAAFAEFAGESGCIATAHNADDNAETVLMNLSRGMGPRGACGIPQRRGNIYRPLLRVSRQEIELLCSEYGLSYVTDSTNADVEYTRNRLRHNVLPELKRVNPETVEAISRFTDSMALQQEFMVQQASALLSESEGEWGHDLKTLRAAHSAVLRVALEMLLRPVGRLSYEHLVEAERCVRCGGALSLPGGAQLTAKQDTLTITFGAQNEECVPLIDGKAALPDGRTLFVSKKFTENQKNGSKVHNLLFNNFSNYDRITSTVTVRTRRSGDRFRPMGRGVGKSLKKLMNELRIPAAVRDKLWLLEAEGEIIWIESVGMADGWKDVEVQLVESTVK